MSKEKFHMEYPLKGSAGMIWKYIGTDSGLSAWFADRVEITDKTYNFYWGKTECRSATLVSQRNGVYVKFRWNDEDTQTYFEMRILFNEMTREHTLEITDFAESDEINDQKGLWDSQIEHLKRQSGM